MSVWSSYLDDVDWADPAGVRPGCEPRLLLQPGRARHAIVLVHGLSDSPHFMRAIAARCNLGVLRMQGRDYVGAQALFEEALALDPGHVLTRKNLVLVLETSGDPAPLIPHLEILVEQDPADLWSLERLGRAHTSLGDKDEALRWFGRALAVAPPERRPVLERWIESIRGLYSGKTRSTPSP